MLLEAVVSDVTKPVSKLPLLAETDRDNFHLIRTQRDLADFMRARESNPRLVGGLIGTEGSHALDGKLENIQLLFDEGLRMMGLQHFFDNKLGGSLHGTSQSGLTEFGRQALTTMQQLNIIIDLSHTAAFLHAHDYQYCTIIMPEKS